MSARMAPAGLENDLQITAIRLSRLPTLDRRIVAPTYSFAISPKYLYLTYKYYIKKL